MADFADLSAFRGHDVVDRSGTRLGRVDDIASRAMTRDTWMRVDLFETHEVKYVPARGAAPYGQDLQIPFAGDLVVGAPSADPSHDLSPQEERRLFEHYGMQRRDPEGPWPSEGPPPDWP